MINKDTKDFSEALPAITSKVLAVASGLHNTGFSDTQIEPEEATGLGHILMDVVEDLKFINDILYGEHDNDPHVANVKGQGAQAL